MFWPASLRFAPFAIAAVAAMAVASCSAPAKPPPSLPEPDHGCAGRCPATAIRHLVVVVQENHTFDNHFGRYCRAPSGSKPTCNDGPDCCEAAPAADPTGTAPTALDDTENGARDPDHSQVCEDDEMNGGAMDRFATAACGHPRNVAYAPESAIAPYWELARTGALADRYFQPVSGASAANDMFLARAGFVFRDNDLMPKGAIGIACTGGTTPQQEFTEPTIGDLLDREGIPWAFYAEGYEAMKSALATGKCPAAPADCPARLAGYPCVYDASDVPFAFFPSSRDNPQHIKDYAELERALESGGLPAVVFVKSIGYRTEHPGGGTRLSDGVAFVTGLISRIFQSRYRDDTLVLLTYDEGGGYFDHVAPPLASAIDGQPYGTRVPTLATGRFAKKNFVSHVVMEHASIVKFVEWNWLGRKTGQLGTRDADAAVKNIGSLLDPEQIGAAIPDE